MISKVGTHLVVLGDGSTATLADVQEIAIRITATKALSGGGRPRAVTG